MATRTRTWTCVSYETEEKIVEALENLHISYAYQTHDKDNKPTHTHIIVQYSSVKSLAQARKDLEKIAANGFVEQVRDTRAAIRYLSHIDHPEKAQYDKPKCKGLDIQKFFMDEPDRENYEEMIKLLQFISSWDIKYYCDLIDILQHYKNSEEENQEWDWETLLKTALNRKYINATLAYIKSRDVKANRDLN